MYGGGGGVKRQLTEVGGRGEGEVYDPKALSTCHISKSMKLMKRVKDTKKGKNR